jgi:2-dehydro-3-deoxy-D-arabinonate dehydratase
MNDAVAYVHIPGEGRRLAIVRPHGLVLAPEVESVSLASLVATCDSAGQLRDALNRLAAASTHTVAWDDLSVHGEVGTPYLLAPIDEQQCWGAGCTYAMDAKSEAQLAETRPLYAAAYRNARPLLFFKSSAEKVIGTGGAIGLRRGAQQTIPEAELAVLFAPNGRPLAYGMGNDVTGLDLEMENPLYQPQAKVFDGSAAVGPWWKLAEDDAPIPLDPFTCTVLRNGSEVLSQTIQPKGLRRDITELAARLMESNSFPRGVVLFTGGGASVPEGFTLESGDTVVIHHPTFGTLRNSVASNTQNAKPLLAEPLSLVP